MSKMFEENIVYRPFAYEWAVDIDRDHEKMHWIEDEVPLGDDLSAWKGNKLSENEKTAVTKILRMFTTQDVLVGSYYFNNLIPIFKNNELRNMLAGFAVREKTHQRSYALLNDTLGLPESDYAAFLHYQELKEKAEYALESDQSTLEGLALTLAKGVFNEGVSLFASFAMLINFQRFGKMLGMSRIVEFSLKDENQHCQGVSKLFRALCEEHPHIVNDDLKRSIYTIAREIVRLEDAFIDLVYSEHEFEGLKKVEIKEYIRYIADRRLNQLGLKENFHIEKNPLSWLDWIVSGIQHTNFFEGKSTSYVVAGLQGDWGYEDIEPEYIVYTRNDCPYCVKAKNLLSSLNIEYKEVDMSDYDLRQKFFEDHGFVNYETKTMPKIYKGSEYIGGYTELSRFLK